MKYYIVVNEVEALQRTFLSVCVFLCVYCTCVCVSVLCGMSGGLFARRLQ